MAGTTSSFFARGPNTFTNPANELVYYEDLYERYGVDEEIECCPDECEDEHSGDEARGDLKSKSISIAYSRPITTPKENNRSLRTSYGLNRMKSQSRNGT